MDDKIVLSGKLETLYNIISDDLVANRRTHTKANQLLASIQQDLDKSKKDLQSVRDELDRVKKDSTDIPKSK